MISSSQVDSQEGDQNMLTICHPSLATDEGHTSMAFDTSGCIPTFEIGSTSRRYDEAKKMSSSLVTSNTCKKRLEINLQNCNLLSKNYVQLKKVPDCKFCAAKRFEYDSPGFCCDNGSIKLISHQMPTELTNLVLGNTEECKHFRTYSRMYNNMFAFTSLGVNYDKNLAQRNRGIYTFRVQGQMYHFIDDLIAANERPKNLQLYFYDNEAEITN